MLGVLDGKFKISMFRVKNRPSDHPPHCTFQMYLLPFISLVGWGGKERSRGCLGPAPAINASNATA